MSSPIYCTCAVNKLNHTKIKIMEITEDISTELFQEAHDYKFSTSEIIFQGNKTNILVEGEVLEAQIKISNDRYLLFLTHNCMFEETLTIALVDFNKGKVIESMWLGSAYNTDFLYGPRIKNNKIYFEFLSQKTWCLQVFNTRKYSFLSLMLFSIIHRAFSLKSYFHIRKI